MTITQVKLSQRTRVGPPHSSRGVLRALVSGRGTHAGYELKPGVRVMTIGASLVLWFPASHLSAWSLLFLFFCKKKLRIHTLQEFCKVWCRIPYALKAQQMTTTIFIIVTVHIAEMLKYLRFIIFRMCCVIWSGKWSWVMHALLGRLGVRSEHSGPCGSPDGYT